MLSTNPIGVFDSGVGGLTVYRALRAVLPHEDFIYLGDTAHLPYGSKSNEVIAQYTVDAARTLLQRGIKFFVVACNTASAYALTPLQQTLPDLPYCGVIAAGADAAVAASKNGRIAVLATEATVRSGIFPDIILSLRRDAEVQMLACNLLVALAEEGWREGPEAEAIVKRYIGMLKPGFDTLVLGCTHFPLLMPVFRKICGPEISIVDNAEITAQAVAGLLQARKIANSQEVPGKDQFLVTDMPDRFAKTGAMFLGRDIAAQVQVL